MVRAHSCALALQPTGTGAPISSRPVGCPASREGRCCLSHAAPSSSMSARASSSDGSRDSTRPLPSRRSADTRPSRHLTPAALHTYFCTPVAVDAFARPPNEPSVALTDSRQGMQFGSASWQGVMKWGPSHVALARARFAAGPPTRAARSARRPACAGWGAADMSSMHACGAECTRTCRLVGARTRMQQRSRHAALEAAAPLHCRSPAVNAAVPPVAQLRSHAPAQSA